MMRVGLRPRIVEQVLKRPDPLARLRARRFGLDGLLGRKAPLELYYEVGDPYSHLCLQWLNRHQAQLNCPLRLVLIPAPDEALFPEAERQRDYALADARLLAPSWGFSAQELRIWPQAKDRQRVERALLQCPSESERMSLALKLAPPLLAGETQALDQALAGLPACSESDAVRQLIHNGRQRQRLRHYLPGMWHYRGDWFWGLDRLPHLQQRLIRFGALQADAQMQTLAQMSAAELPSVQPDSRLEFFYSFRSPYSHLAAVKLARYLPDWNVQLRIRPVLPMVMRGFKVPSAKRLYIARDAYREAARQQIPFGQVADPLGPAILQGLQLFEHFTTAEQQLQFLIHYGEMCWAYGQDLSKPGIARQAVEAAGGNWSQARTLLVPEREPMWISENRQALLERGLWGVPSFSLGELQLWGQDRMTWLDEALRRAQK